MDIDHSMPGTVMRDDDVQEHAFCTTRPLQALEAAEKFDYTLSIINAKGHEVPC